MATVPFAGIRVTSADVLAAAAAAKVAAAAPVTAPAAASSSAAAAAAAAVAPMPAAGGAGLPASVDVGVSLDAAGLASRLAWSKANVPHFHLTVHLRVDALLKCECLSMPAGPPPTRHFVLRFAWSAGQRFWHAAVAGLEKAGERRVVSNPTPLI